MSMLGKGCLVSVALVSWGLALQPQLHGAIKPSGKPERPGAQAGAMALPEDPICNVDFRNFTYRVSEHTMKAIGVPPEIVLRNGQTTIRSSKGDRVDIGITRIVYGELTGDNAYEAVVRVSSVVVGASYGMDDLYVFRQVSGKPQLVAVISEYEMDSAYMKQFPEGGLWPGNTGLKIRNRVLEVEKYADSGVNQPKYNARLTYRLEGGAMVVTGVTRSPYAMRQDI